jgi:transcriptional regulator with XRE-family HTH domain
MNMDSFDRILNRVSNSAQRNWDKNLAIANRIIELLRAQQKSTQELAQALRKSEKDVQQWLTGFHAFDLQLIFKMEKFFEADIILIPEPLG